MSALFQREIEPRCAYCAHGRPLKEGEVICKKKGVVDAGGHCHAFRYDPLQRVPPRLVKVEFSGLKDEDFTL